MRAIASSDKPAPQLIPAFDDETTGRVLIVDGDVTTRSAHRSMLGCNFDVLTAASGEQAIELCKARSLDLIILEVTLPGIDGYETCRKLRTFLDIPILFVACGSTLESQLDAFDAGGNDLILKPANPEIFPRKIALAIRQHRAQRALEQEKKTLERMAMGFLSSASQTGTLLEFMRRNMAVTDYPDLANNLLTTIQDLGLQACVLIRHPDGGATASSANSTPSPLETSMLENVRGMGRLFQFKRHLVVNYDRVSIIVSNMPDEQAEQERAGILRDSLAILAESAEVMAVNVDLRLEGQKRAEQIQVALSEAELAVNVLGDQTRVTLCDTRLLLQEMIEGIEKTYAWLDISNSQEAEISATMDESVQRILRCLAKGGGFDAQLSQVLAALNAGRGQGQDMVELF
ncbi:two-component system response regulator [Zoogloea sp.]|uniref:response regulator n=1 Tax=Zoogloea sp. TaxID=49181 RepID=UPI0035B10A3D